MSKERRCEKCGVSEEELGFELDTDSDGEYMCEQCMEDEWGMNNMDNEKKQDIGDIMQRLIEQNYCQIK